MSKTPFKDHIKHRNVIICETQEEVDKFIKFIRKTYPNWRINNLYKGTISTSYRYMYINIRDGKTHISSGTSQKSKEIGYGMANWNKMLMFKDTSFYDHTNPRKPRRRSTICTIK